MENPAAANPPQPTGLSDVARLFLKLGLTAYGGPAAHIAMMHDEVVTRRKWLSDQEFLDLIGATNLIPGPNSTEMAIHIGYRQAGLPGLLTAGICFIFPAMLAVLLLAWLYVRYGATPQAEWVLYGVKPVVIAIIVQALINLGRKAVKGWFLAAAGLAVLALYFAGLNELILLLAGGLLALAGLNLARVKMGNRPGALLLLPLAAGLNQVTTAAAAVASFTLTRLFFTFLKIGAVLYGSGYVLLAFLRADLVVRYGWLTDQQLIDAVAVGQITPGPLFTTATFIGYILGGLPGGLLATLAIFLPSFVFVALSSPLVPRLRGSVWFGSLLDGVNVASLGLMAAVTWELGRASLTDPLTIVMALAALGLLARLKINSMWLILGGLLIGLGRGIW